MLLVYIYFQLFTKLLLLFIPHTAYEQAVKQQQMRTEMSQAKRENKHYRASVDKSKAIEAIVKRKRKRGVAEEGKEVRNFRDFQSYI